MDPIFHAVHVAAVPLAAVGRGDAIRAFAVVLVAQTMLAAEVPQIAGRRHLHFRVAGEFAVLRIGDDPRPLVEIGGNGCVAPAMPVHADLAVAVEVVQEHVVAGKLVLVGSDFFAVHRELGIAVADQTSSSVMSPKTWS